MRLEDDVVRDATNPDEIAHYAFGDGALILPADVPFQSHPPLTDRRRDSVSWHTAVPFQSGQYRLRELGVGSFVPAAQPYIEIVRHGLHAVHTQRDALGRRSFRATLHVAAQRHHTVFS